MSSLDDLRSILGDPLALDPDSDSIWSEIEADLSATVPDDARDFLNAYGGLMIEGFLAIHHPGALLDVHQDFGPQIIRNRRIPDPLLPSPGGMLIWGNTVDADQLFLVQRSGGWRVAAWCRQWVEWYETELSLPAWISHALSPEQNVQWLPEWEFPLSVEEL
ncbi:hypothetical protein [Streptacidiphilus anmyonensis]|uniref:hypothetical protein n=1 Tax=Streptacidiphilus anmyonensis TaxID=405782 RepID=UPI0005A629AC|nr:hypothetical protein [Streptacidiphilus anmyonensis]